MDIEFEYTQLKCPNCLMLIASTNYVTHECYCFKYIVRCRECHYLYDSKEINHNHKQQIIINEDCQLLSSSNLQSQQKEFFNKQNSNVTTNIGLDQFEMCNNDNHEVQYGSIKQNLYTNMNNSKQQYAWQKNQYEKSNRRKRNRNQMRCDDLELIETQKLKKKFKRS